MSEHYPSMDQSESGAFWIAENEIAAQNRALFYLVRQQYFRQERQRRAKISAGPHLNQEIPQMQERLSQLDNMTSLQQHQTLAHELEFLVSEIRDQLDQVGEGNLGFQMICNQLRRGNWSLKHLVSMRHRGGCNQLPELFRLLESYDHYWLRAQLRTHRFFADAIPKSASHEA